MSERTTTRRQEPEGEPTVGVSCRRAGIGDTGDVEPCVVVIFGASGDLTRRELVPALFELARLELLPDPFAVVGAARRTWSDEDFRKEMRSSVPGSEGRLAGAWEAFRRHLHYVPMDLAGPAGQDYAELAEKVGAVRERHGVPDNLLFHLSVPPSLFTGIARRLGAAGLHRGESGWRRLVIEKPFGEDRASARELDEQLKEVFPEDRIFRIDHFLGKETVQNMLVFRFANPGYEPVWNRNYVDHVQITVAEEIGVGTRGAFYEETGVVRDMVQNHLLQLLCVTAIEPPVRCLGTSLRDETTKVLQAVASVDPDRDFVGGQYGPGPGGGTEVPGYREEERVADDSTTPTFAALRLEIDNWRWAGVPFYLRTGKRLERKLTEVVVHFRPTPHRMFPGQDGRHRSTLTFRLQPEEGIVQRFVAKRPGPGLHLEPVRMRFDYGEAFGVEEMPSAYAWLLLDAMQGDRTLFARSDWIDRAWSVVDPLVEHWESGPTPELPNYEAGSWGPEAAHELLRRDGRRWGEI